MACNVSVPEGDKEMILRKVLRHSSNIKFRHTLIFSDVSIIYAF